MHSFHASLSYVDRTIFAPNHLIVTRVKEERQNSDYAAGRFKLSTGLDTKTVRFRVAKQTPTKIGQFVTFWEKTLIKPINLIRSMRHQTYLLLLYSEIKACLVSLFFQKLFLLRKAFLEPTLPKVRCN